MAVVIPFNRERDFRAGVLEEVAPGIRRVVAPNPGPFTFAGTNTYVVGQGRVAVIDPGPDLAVHVETLTRALARESVTHIFVTHTHNDHSPAARPLKAATGALVCAYGPHGPPPGGSGPQGGVARADDGVAIEEGADVDFVPDLFMADGERIAGPGWTIEAVHTPGHTSNHLCYAFCEERALFTGDHVMSWSTSVIAPPDGDMQAYIASLQKLLARKDRVLWPAHGGPVREPEASCAPSSPIARSARPRSPRACGAASGTFPTWWRASMPMSIPRSIRPPRGPCTPISSAWWRKAARPATESPSWTRLPHRLSFVTPCSTD